MINGYSLLFTAHHMIEVQVGLWNLMAHPQISEYFFIKIEQLV